MTQNQPKEKRIRHIIDTAVLELIEKGYEGASMESIARRVGLSKGGLYHHFQSKDEILIEANNRFMEPVIKLMKACRLNISPAEGLKEYIEKYLEHWKKHPRELQFTFLSLFKILSQKEMWGEMESYSDQTIDFFRNMLTKGIRCGEFKQHDVESRALAMAFSLDGATPYLMMNKHLTSEKITYHLVQMYISEIEIRKHG